MPPKLVHKTPHGSIVQHEDGTSVLLPDHLATALTADPVAPLAGTAAPPGAITASDKTVLQQQSKPDPQLLRFEMDAARKSKGYTPAQAIAAGLGMFGTALDGGGTNPVISQIDGQIAARDPQLLRYKMDAARKQGGDSGYVPVYGGGRPGSQRPDGLTLNRDWSNEGTFAQPPIMERLRAAGLSGPALEAKLRELGYNTSGFGGQ